MQVNDIVSSINMILVKDRVSYALHNLREIMIMQIRLASECKQTSEELSAS